MDAPSLNPTPDSPPFERPRGRAAALPGWSRRAIVAALRVTGRVTTARLTTGLLVTGLLALGACTCLPGDTLRTARATLAPTGSLRVGVYPGSPTSLVGTPGSAEMRGVTVELGQALAQRLGVPVEMVVLPRVAEVVEALKTGRADMTLTNATPARAREVDFTRPLIALELGYLVRPGSLVTSVDTADQEGVRIGVSQGSSSQAALGARFQRARLVPMATLAAASEALRRGELDAFATNKAILFEMADSLPGAQVLPGRWGLEHLAIAIPHGRDAARPALQGFADALRAEGLVDAAAKRAGLRGTVAPLP